MGPGASTRRNEARQSATLDAPIRLVGEAERAEQESHVRRAPTEYPQGVPTAMTTAADQGPWEQDELSHDASERLSDPGGASPQPRVQEREPPSIRHADAASALENPAHGAAAGRNPLVDDRPLGPHHPRPEPVQALEHVGIAAAGQIEPPVEWAIQPVEPRPPNEQVGGRQELHRTAVGVPTAVEVASLPKPARDLVVEFGQHRSADDHGLLLERHPDLVREPRRFDPLVVVDERHVLGAEAAGDRDQPVAGRRDPTLRLDLVDET